MSQGLPDLGPSPLTEDRASSLMHVTWGGEDVAPERAPIKLQPGTIIPGTRYRIERWLGEGGVGVVYECQHVDIERRVAFKVLRPEVSPASQKAALFRAEARAAVRSRELLTAKGSGGFQIGSPYIVEVYDFGEFPDGRLWFAMELLHGVSLQNVLKGPDGGGIAMDPGRAIGILRQVCKGLYTAHESGIIHRDVKPPNIMLVSRVGRPDCVKIVDFGVAAMLAEQSNERDSLVGTPHYMAPEQTRDADFDHRLDIYALGVMAYRMLTGRVPFSATSLFELMRHHRSTVPPPPSSVLPTVPKALDGVVLRCLEKIPGDRFANMLEVEAALCEAQIDAGLTTAWDDLPLPDVDAERRARLLRLMPDAHGRRPERRLLWPVVAGIAIAAALTATWFAVLREPPVAADVDAGVDTLVQEARAAGAKAAYVYPDADRPDDPTAYLKVLELEAMKTSPANVAADSLRKEFADTLSRLGDRYWDHPGARGFALDYYAQAIVFQPDHAKARERAPMTPGELALLRDKAATGGFSEADLRATRPLVALAEPDDAERDRKVRDVIEQSDDHAVSTEARLQAVLEDSPTRVASSKPRERASAKPKAVASAAVVPAHEPAPTETETGRATTEPKRPPEAAGSGKEDARALTKRGEAALASADRSTAERLFHQALSRDSHHPGALSGLSAIHYDQGAYGKAVAYAQKAVAAAPTSAKYRLQLGDAYFKSFKYAEARAQYEKAKSLGNKAAVARLAKVAEKTGP